MNIFKIFWNVNVLRISNHYRLCKYSHVVSKNSCIKRGQMNTLSLSRLWRKAVIHIHIIFITDVIYLLQCPHLQCFWNWKFEAYIIFHKCNSLSEWLVKIGNIFLGFYTRVHGEDLNWTACRLSFSYTYICIYTRGYQKVRRLMWWNQYNAYKLCREYKTTHVLSALTI